MRSDKIARNTSPLPNLPFHREGLSVYRLRRFFRVRLPFDTQPFLTRNKSCRVACPLRRLQCAKKIRPSSENLGCTQPTYSRVYESASVSCWPQKARTRFRHRLPFQAVGNADSILKNAECRP